MGTVYQIGVAILLQDGISAGLAAIGGSLFNLEGKVKSLQSALGGLRAGMLLGGGAAIFGGVEAIRGLDHLIRKTAEYSDEMVKVQRLGITGPQFGEVMGAAQQLPLEIPGLTQSDILKTYAAGFSMVGHAHMMEMLPAIESWSQAVGQSTGDYEKAHDQMRTMLKGGELLGAFTDPQTRNIDTKRMKDFLDMSAQFTAASHNMVNPEQMLAFAKQAGPAAMSLSKAGFATEMILTQSMGGFRAGTALLSLFNQMAAGKMTAATATALQNMDFLHKGEWQASRGGGVVVQPEARERLWAQFGQDPLDVAHDLINKFVEQGITDPLKQIERAMPLFGRQTTQRMMAELMRNEQQNRAERERILKAMGIDASRALANEQSIKTALHNLDTSIEYFRNSLVAGPGGDVPRLLNRFADGFKAVGSYLGKHPGLGTAAIEGGFAAAATAIAAGTAAIVGGLARGSGAVKLAQLAFGRSLATGTAAAAAAETGAAAAAGAAAGRTLIGAVVGGLVSVLAAAVVGKMAGDIIADLAPGVDSKRLDERRKEKLAALHPGRDLMDRGPTGELPLLLHQIKAHQLAEKEFEKLREKGPTGNIGLLSQLPKPPRQHGINAFDLFFGDQLPKAPTPPPEPVKPIAPAKPLPGIEQEPFAVPDMKPPTITPNINTEGAASKVKTDIEAVKPNVKVETNADTSKLKAQIESAVKGPFTVDVHANVTGMPSGGSGGGKTSGGGGGGAAPASTGTASRVPPARQTQIALHSHTYLDGVKIAENTTHHMNNQLRMATQGAVHPDTTRHGHYPADTISPTSMVG